MRRDIVVRSVVNLPQKGTDYSLGKRQWYSLTPNQKDKLKELRKNNRLIRLTYYVGKPHPILEEICQKDPNEFPLTTETLPNTKYSS